MMVTIKKKNENNSTQLSTRRLNKQIRNTKRNDDICVTKLRKMVQISISGIEIL